MNKHLQHNAHRYLISFVVVGVVYYLTGCAALGIPSSESLRAMADAQDAIKDTAQKALEVASAVPGWPGLVASTLATTLAGGATLNKYRNLTRATDPRVSNVVRTPNA